MTTPMSASGGAPAQGSHAVPEQPDRHLIDENFGLIKLQDDYWTIGDALQGTHIFGATGSGKTSGSGQQIAIGMMKAGMGGLVLTVKPDEAELWRNYCVHGNKVVVIFGPRVTQSNPYSFNFLEYERKCVMESVQKRYPDEDRATIENLASLFLTENLVNLFSTIMEVAQRGGSSSAKGEAYWQGAVRQLLRNTLDLLILSGQKLTFRRIYEIISTAPACRETAEEVRTAGIASPQTTFEHAVAKISKLPANHPRFEDAALILAYWLDEFPVLSPETRSVIVSYFTSVADPFLRGTLRDLFSPEHDTWQLDPQLIRDGLVVVLNLPVKEFFELGQFAQVLYKYIFQRAMERDSDGSEEPRPVFLWADEAQFFLTSQDMLFQTTARSSKVATVYLTQNISSYYALMPGEQGKAQTDSLLGNFVTKIFHANSDSVTNKWAAELIAKGSVYRRSMNTNASFNAPGERTGKHGFLKSILLGPVNRNNSGYNLARAEHNDYQVPPLEFTKLITGGVRNNLAVQGIFVQGGRVTPEGKNFQLLRFHQEKL